MIWAWITAEGLLGLRKGLWLLIAIAALVGFAIWLGAREAADDKANQEIGAAVQREGDLVETFNQVEKANEAEARLDRDPDARRAGCLQHSRTPANC